MLRPLPTRPFKNTGQMCNFFQGVGIKKNIAINNNHKMEIKYFLFLKISIEVIIIFLRSLKKFRSYVVIFINSIYKEDEKTVR